MPTQALGILSALVLLLWGLQGCTSGCLDDCDPGGAMMCTPGHVIGCSPDSKSLQICSPDGQFALQACSPNATCMLIGDQSAACAESPNMSIDGGDASSE